jgi:hypothetical protein
MYIDIVESELVYPAYLNPLAVDLLKGLLDKDQTSRYSYFSVDQIKKHPWCSDIDWNSIAGK